MTLRVKYFLLILLLPLVIKGNETVAREEDSEEVRQPRGRIVKLYSGIRPEPILCSKEGFLADPHDCIVFYRCIKSSSGKYTVFRFQCSPGTVYDPETEICNHPRSTKRSECGGYTAPSLEQNNDLNSNEIVEFENEVPKPISTKLPVYSVSSTIETSSISPTTTTSKPQTTSYDIVKETTKYPPVWVSESLITTIKSTHEDNKHVSFEYPSSTRQQGAIVTTTNAPNSQRNICVSEGFMGDSEDCHKFYRCISNQRGSFMKFEFSCSELTIWDDDIQACNHPWAVKRSRCGRSSVDFNEVNKIDSTKDNHMGLMKTTTDRLSENQINNEDSQHLQTTYEKENLATSDKIEKNQSQINHIATQLPDQYYQSIQKQEDIKTTANMHMTTDMAQISSTLSTENTNNSCTETGFFGDPIDCKKFYRCVNTGKGNYIKYEFSCGDGTVWDQSLEGCNHAWAVPKCGGNVPSTVSNIESVPQTSPISSTTVFTKPTTNAPTATEIDSEEDVGYGNIDSSVKTTTIRTTTIVNSSETKLNDCKSSGFIGDAKDCSIFYRCVEDGNGAYIKYEFKCGSGTLWDSNLEACNHDLAVKNCGGIETSVENVPTTIASQTSQIPISTSTTISSVVLTSSTVLDQSNEEEDSGYNGQTNGVSSSTTTLQNSLINEENKCKANGFFGNKNDCTKFFRCIDNGDGTFNKFEFVCSEGTVWDSKIEACNYAWAVENCNGSSLHTTSEVSVQATTSHSQHDTATTNKESSPIDSIRETTPLFAPSSTIVPITSVTSANMTNDCQSTGFIGDTTNCKKFYRCVDNGDGTFTKFEFSCGDGTVWDQKIGSCNHAWAVEKCGKIDENLSTTSASTNHKPTLADDSDNGYTVSSVTTHETTHEIHTTTSIDTITNICKESGFVVDKNDCQKFYRCVDDGKGGFSQFEYRCGEGTVWDSSIEACNHIWAVKECKHSSVNNEINETSTHKTSTTADQNLHTTISSNMNVSETITETTINDVCKYEGFIGDNSDCKKFYRCVQHSQGFIKYEFQCGDGTYWNQEIQACDHTSSTQNCYIQEQETIDAKPQIENDDIYTETPTGNTTISQGSSNTQNPVSSKNSCESEGFFEDPSDCKKFYRCVEDSNNGYTKYNFTCGDGTIWNQAIMACDHPTAENKCVGETTINQTNNSNTVNESSIITSTHSPGPTQQVVVPQSTECNAEGFFANPDDCKKFFRCTKDDKNGYIKYDFDCGLGTIWVQEIQACDHDNGIDSCSSINTTHISTSTQTSIQTSAGANTSATNQMTTTTEISTSTKNTDEFYTTTKNSNEVCSAEGFFENQNDCKMFYRCVDNGQGGFTKYEFSCGEGTAWDSTIQGCNHIDNVKNCNASREEEGQTQPSLHDEIPDNEDKQNTTNMPSTQTTENINPEEEDICENEGYFGDSTNCKQFYRCVDDGKGEFTKYEFTCGEGTIWDQDLTTCNYPQDVSNPSCNDDGEYVSMSPTESFSPSDRPSTPSTSSESAIDAAEISNDTNSSNCSQDSSSNKPSQNITCSEAGFYPNPNDCKKFYRCVDWDGNGEKFSVFHFECGDGTIWDPALETCNYEESVYPPRECTGTQSQNQNTGQESTTKEQEASTQPTSITTTSSNGYTTTEQVATSQETTTEPTTPTSTAEELTTQQTTTEAGTTQQQGSVPPTIPSTTQQETSAQTTTQQTTSETSATEQQTSTESTTTQQQSNVETTTQQATSTSSLTTVQQTTESVIDETISSTQISTTQQTTTEVLSTTMNESANATTDEPTTTVDISMTEQTTTQKNNSTQSTTNLTDEPSTTEKVPETENTSTTEINKESTTDEASESSPSEVTSEPSSTDAVSTTETSTGENSNCPDTDDDQNVFVCPTSFRRHPKYCNIFYQCTEDEDTHEIKVATFKCPNNTIYDEDQTKCVDENKTNKQCEGEISSRRRLKHLSLLDYKEPITVTRDSQSCLSEGHMPFEKNSECSPAFLKCEKTKKGKLRGIVHQCPQNYVYWTISRRCERIDKVRDCRRTTNNWMGRWEIPIDRHNVAW